MKSIARNVPPCLVSAITFLMALPSVALAHGDEADPGHVISVSGNASTQVAPDLLRIRFGVETQAEVSAEAVSANADLMNKVVEAVRHAGVDEDEISTTQFNVQAVYETVQDRTTGQRSQVLSGYRVSNVLLIQTPQLERAADILDGATRAGANRVDSVEYALDAVTMKSVQDELIEDAVLDARDRASRALAPLGYRVAGVQNMSLGGFAAPVQRFADAPMMEMSRAAPTPLFASDQDVSVSVHVSFLIAPTP